MHLTLNQPPRSEGSPHSGPSQRRVLISGGLATGGMQTHVTLLCTLLRRAGAEVTIVSASSNWTAADLARLRALGVRIIVSPFGFGQWQLLGKLWVVATGLLFLRRDFDVLYCIGEGNMHFWARRFVRNGGFQLYHEIVECIPDVLTPSSALGGEMNGLIANSTRVAGQLGERFPGVPVRTIPFCTAAAPMPPPPHRPAVGQRELRIAYLGRLVSHKRPVELLESFAALHTRAPLAPARLDFYGGEQAGIGEEMRKRIANAGLEKNVALHGAYAYGDLEQILATADLVVLPSRYEGLPLVLVEAMQRGIPVVATSAGGTAELGLDNPDVIISPGTDWAPFQAGLLEMAARLRAGEVDSRRLHAWTESRYGFTPVAAAWREALLLPQSFFAAPARQEARS